MKKLSILACLAILGACQPNSADTPDAESLAPAEQSTELAAVTDTTRLKGHKSRDAARKPSEILAFSGVKPGDKVADLAAIGGYYTALLSRHVGDEGHVYAVDPTLALEEFPSAKKDFPKFVKGDPRANVSYSIQRLDQLVLDEPVDHIFMVLYYHDTLWLGVDRDAMNTANFNSLKPGGSLLIVEHDGLEGAGAETGKSLHRMDCDLIAPEVIKAGFTLEDSSDILRNTADPLDVSVFARKWRGKTDRCVLKFRKPG